MLNGVTRRGVLQLFAALTVAVPALTRGAFGAALLPETPPAESVDGPSRPTLLESYLRSRGVRPAHLARELRVRTRTPAAHPHGTDRPDACLRGRDRVRAAAARG